MLSNINLWRYFSDNFGVGIGMFLACYIHCVFNLVGMRDKSFNVFLRWIPLVVFNKNKEFLIGDLVQSYGEIRVMFCAPPCLTSMCCINPLYILLGLPLSLIAFMSCSPIHVMYAFFNERTYVPNISCGNCVTTFDIHFGRLHMYYGVQLFSSLVSQCPGEDMGRHKNCKQC